MTVTVAELRRWAETMPGALIPASVLLEALEGLEEPEPAIGEGAPMPPSSWRERLWSVPAETRLGIAEVSEALDRPRSYIYARTGKAENPIPHRKLDGLLVFAAGEVRAWIRDHEEVVAAGPYLSVKGDAA